MRSLLLLFLAGAAVAQAPAAYKPKPYGTLKQVMRGILLPNSDMIFAVQTTAPKDAAAWTAVENEAIALEESANLITMAGRLRSDGKPVPVQNADWSKYANGLVTASQSCYKAAQSKSQDAVSNCTDGLTNACSNCHNVYRDKPPK